MKVTLKDKVLTITCNVSEATPSASGKTLVIASSRGNKLFEDVKYNGKCVTIGLNAYISAKAA